MKKQFGLVILMSVFGLVLNVQADHDPLGRINAYDAQNLLGDGTGVIIGFLDSGIDKTHRGFRDPNSLGQSRLIAEGNFVPTEPTNTGDDVGTHGTAVASVALGYDSDLVGLQINGIATDASYVNARVMDSANSFNSNSWLLNGAGFAVQHNSDIINLSLNLFSSTLTNGNSTVTLMVDYLAYQHGIAVVTAAGNNGGLSGSSHLPRSPADNFNGITVGSTQSTAYDSVVSTSAWGPTADGRIKPDVVAPGSQITTAHANWETTDDYRVLSGTSFAAPHVSGMLATQIEYGRENNLNTNVLVLKSTLLNSAEKINGRLNQPWAPNASFDVNGATVITSPMDTQQGAGQIDGLALYEQYSAGEQGPGSVNAIGWDYHTIIGTEAVEYTIDDVLELGTYLDITLTWNRHVGLVDRNDDDMLDGGDSFQVLETLDNLNIELLLDGEVIAHSFSSVDNVEHLHYLLEEEGIYSFRVTRIDVAGSGLDEAYGVAWSSVSAIPEPTSLLSLMCIAGAMFSRHRNIN